MFENITGGCGRAGNACLNAPQQLTLQKGKFSVPQGHQVKIILVPGGPMPERLDCMKTSLCPLSRHLCHGCLHTAMQAHSCTVCVCMVCRHMVCVWSMPYMSHATYVGFLNLSIHIIYIALLFFSPHAVMEVFLKNE